MAEAATEQACTESTGQNITEHERAQEDTFDLVHQLREFICLSGIDNLMKRRDLTGNDTLAQVVRLIPSGCHCSGDVCSRIILGNRSYETEHFKETRWKQTAYVMIGKKKIGLVETCRLTRPQEDHTFLKEEKKMLKAIAKLVGLFIGREKADETLKHRQQALRACENDLSEFLRKTLSDTEEEKKKLSADLHDELGSMAISLGFSLSIAEEELKGNNPQIALDNICQARSNLKAGIAKMKQIAKGLSPQNFDIIDLPEVLKDYLANIESRADIKTQLRVDIQDGKSLDDKAKIVLYRVFQEALNNVLRHAQATSVKAQLHLRGNTAKLEIRDNGIGFDTTPPDETASSGMGIRGMKGRANSLGGVFDIRSSPGNGTTIKVTIPIDQLNSANEARTDRTDI